jgi:hypothetical protein
MRRFVRYTGVEMGGAEVVLTFLYSWAVDLSSVQTWLQMEKGNCVDAQLITALGLLSVENDVLCC